MELPVYKQMEQARKKRHKQTAAKKQRCLEIMEGRHEEKTTSEWAQHLGVNMKTLQRWMLEIGKRCKIPPREKKPPKPRKPRRYDLTDVEEARCELMAEWARRPIR